MLDIDKKWKKWITVAVIVVLSAININAVSNMLPEIVSNNISYISYAGLLAAYWVYNSETE